MTTIHNYQNDDFDPDEMFNYSASYDESTTEYVYDEYVYDEGDKKSSEHTHPLPKVDRKCITSPVYENDVNTCYDGTYGEYDYDEYAYYEDDEKKTPEQAPRQPKSDRNRITKRDSQNYDLPFGNNEGEFKSVSQVNGFSSDVKVGKNYSHADKLTKKVERTKEKLDKKRQNLDFKEIQKWSFSKPCSNKQIMDPLQALVPRFWSSAFGPRLWSQGSGPQTLVPRLWSPGSDPQDLISRL